MNYQKGAFNYMEAAVYMGVSERTIKDLISKGKLPVSYPAGPRNPVILKGRIDTLLEESERVKNQ